MITLDKNRITTASSAYDMVTSVVDAYSSLWSEYDTFIKYLMKGKRPFDPDKLKSQNLDHIININRGKGKSFVEKAVAQKSTDVINSLAIMQIDFESWDKKKHKDELYSFLLDNQMRGDFLISINYALYRHLFSSQIFSQFITDCEMFSFLIGLTPVTFDNNRIIPCANTISNFGFDPEAKVGEVDLFVSFDTLKAKDVWAIYKSCQGKESNQVTEDDTGLTYHVYSNGWVKEGMEDLIEQSFTGEINGSNKPTFEQILSLYETDRNKCIAQTKVATVAKIFSENNNGKGLLEAYVHSQDKNGGSDSRYFLFKKEYKEKSIDEKLKLIIGNLVKPGDKVVDVAGALKMLSTNSVNHDRLMNNLENKMEMSGMPLFVSSSPNQRRALSIRPMGSHTILPPEIALAERQITFDPRPQIEQLSLEESNFSRDSYHISPELPQFNRATKQEVAAVTSHVSAIKSAGSKIKLNEYEEIILACVKKLFSSDDLLPSHERLRERVIDSIVDRFSPLELDREQVVKICRCIKSVTISPIIRDTASIERALSFTETDYGRFILKVMYFMSLGMSPTDAYNQIKPSVNEDDTREAARENADFYSTGEVVCLRSDSHITHLDTHFAKLDRKFAGVQQGEDPVAAFNYIERSLKHCQEHLVFVQGDFYLSKHYERYSGLFERFAQMLKTLATSIRQQAAQRAKVEAENLVARNQQQEQAPDPQTQQSMMNRQAAHEQNMALRDDARQKRQEMMEANNQFRMEQQARKNEFDRQQKLQNSQVDTEIKINQAALK